MTDERIRKNIKAAQEVNSLLLEKGFMQDEIIQIIPFLLSANLSVLNNLEAAREALDAVKGMTLDILVATGVK